MMIAMMIPIDKEPVAGVFVCTLPAPPVDELADSCCNDVFVDIIDTTGVLAVGCDTCTVCEIPLSGGKVKTFAVVVVVVVVFFVVVVGIGVGMEATQVVVWHGPSKGSTTHSLPQSPQPNIVLHDVHVKRSHEAVAVHGVGKKGPSMLLAQHSLPHRWHPVVSAQSAQLHELHVDAEQPSNV